MMLRFQVVFHYNGGGREELAHFRYLGDARRYIASEVTCHYDQGQDVTIWDDEEMKFL